MLSQFFAFHRIPVSAFSSSFLFFSFFFFYFILSSAADLRACFHSLCNTLMILQTVQKKISRWLWTDLYLYIECLQLNEQYPYYKKSWLGWLPLPLCWQMLRELVRCEDWLAAPPISGLGYIRGCRLPFPAEHIKHLSLRSSLAPLPALFFSLDTAWKIHTERREARRRRWWSGREVIRPRPDVPVYPQGPEKSDWERTEQRQQNLTSAYCVTFLSIFVPFFLKRNYLFSFLGNASPFELKVTLLGCDPNLFFQFAIKYIKQVNVGTHP